MHTQILPVVEFSSTIHVSLPLKLQSSTISNKGQKTESKNSYIPALEILRVIKPKGLWDFYQIIKLIVKLVDFMTNEKKTTIQLFIPFFFL